MSDTKKLTRAEANSELAHRINFKPKCVHCINDTQHTGEHFFIWTNFFTSRDNAAELAAFMQAHDRRDEFIEKLASILNIRPVAAPIQLGTLFSDRQVYTFLLATPEQIALAACSALGIETE